MDQKQVALAPETVVPDAFNAVLDDITEERARQIASGVDAYGQQMGVTVNDMLAVAMAYMGRAAELVPRNEREGFATTGKQREMLLKAAAVLVRAVEMHDTDQLFEPAPQGEEGDA